MGKEKRLYELRIGEKAIVGDILHTGSSRRRLMELGVIRGTEIVCVGESPLGNPRAYALCGTVIAIRNADAGGICLRD